MELPMRQPVNTDTHVTDDANADGAPRGPVLLDARMLRLVAGGAPKGGWDADPVDCGLATDVIADFAPKGGW
jgi:hypothetical protein